MDMSLFQIANKKAQVGLGIDGFLLREEFGYP
jgi:hypothetical protein